MKITKSKLKEIIREEIQNLNEGLPWEQELDENWFSDMKATAQKAYIKHNPGSKYAKGVESGDKDAPMTGKEKAIADKEKKEKQDATNSRREKLNLPTDPGEMSSQDYSAEKLLIRRGKLDKEDSFYHNNPWFS